jgi:hypothetical protein
MSSNNLRFSKARNSIQKMEKIIITTKRQVCLNGQMTIGMLEDGRHTADFMCCEEVQMQAFTGLFKVQGMRDGNMYLTEKPRRKRNKPLFREDNSSLSLGRDGRWYFSFSLSDDQLELLPERLVHQASAIAKKVLLQLLVND